MGGLSKWALDNSMLVLVLVLFVILAGPVSYFSHPSRESPEITIRTAVVTASYAGLSPTRMEDLVTRKIEEKAREMPEVDKITSTTGAGQSTVRVELRDQYYDLGPIWQDLRNKMEDVKSDLPGDTSGPFVNDSYGEVAMATIAVTAEGFARAEMRETARNLRNALYTVPGTSKIELFGVEPERIFIEVNNARLAQLGLSASSLIDAVTSTNIISPGGRIEAGSTSFTVEPSGNFESLEDIGQVIIAIPDQPGQVVYLRDLAEIKRAYVDPPKSPAYFNGKPAVIVSVQMTAQFDAFKFGDDLKAKVKALENALPIGYVLDFVTFQPNEIATAVNGVTTNLYQTVVIVLIVVMLFLGWRTGLIVGTMVPLTMLLTLLIMRQVGIELERMSLATLIISLGLLVDNGIVMSEEIGRRMSTGENRFSAAAGTGKAMAMPLLSSSLTTIFAFMPLMLSDNEASEYMRSLSLVIAISLLASWLIAMTATPLFCYWGLKTPEPVDENTAYNTRFYRAYRGFLSRLLNQRLVFMIAVTAALVIAVWGLRFVPKIFFPASDRVQIQVYVDLPVGANTYGTQETALRLSKWLTDTAVNPEIQSHVLYVASGGPRFYLGLNPIDPDPNRAFIIVNVTSDSEVPEVSDRIRRFAANNLPEARVFAKPMSLGASESGLVEYRITGDSQNVLSDLAEQLKSTMRSIPGTINVSDDWDNRIVKILVKIDQARARRANVTSETVARALNTILSGTAVTDYREGDTIIPIYLRSEGDERTSIDRLRTLNIAKSDGTPIPLLQIADFDGTTEFANIQHRNLERIITVSSKNVSLAASELDARISALFDMSNLPAGYRIEKGGEVEGSAEAQGALFAYMPLAFALIVLILVGQFNSLRKPLVIFAVIPLTLIGVTLALLIVPGANFSFTAILGLLSLAGIVINNAIVLIDRIDIELDNGLALNDAILSASVKRLRPIIMTTVTTIFGLMPIIFSGDVLFYDLAVVLCGGLLLGTVLTLGVVPVLYSLFFGRDKVHQAA